MSTPRDIDALAGEYVLGLLEGDELWAVEQSLAHDEPLRRAVSDWRARLAELDDTAAPVSPPADLWSRIESRIAAPAAAEAAKQPGALARLWASLNFWRGAGLAGALASVLLAVGLATLAPPDGPRPAVIAIMQGDPGQADVIVEAYDDGSVRLVPLGGIDVPEGRTLEVWTLWDEERGPVSLGTISAAETLRLVRGDIPPPRPDQLYEITIEPAGGSPTGRPTGPIVVKGLASRPL